MNRGTPWKKLTRADLTTFDNFATEVVLTAMEHNAIGRVSSKGHAQIRCPDGGTMAVARDTSAPHAAQNVRADLRRLFPESQQQNGKTKRKGQQMQESTAQFSDAIGVELPKATNGHAPEPIEEDDLMDCLAKGCGKQFATKEARAAHVSADHQTCQWPGCDLGPDGGPFVGLSNQSLAGHTNIRHKGNKPWLNAQAAQAEQRVKAAKRTIAAQKRAARAVEKASRAAVVPSGVVKPSPTDPAAVLAAIRELLGPDPRVAELQAKVDEMQAHLDLVREALNLNATPKDK